jgi:hypothetical protein
LTSQSRFLLFYVALLMALAIGERCRALSCATALQPENYQGAEADMANSKKFSYALLDQVLITQAGWLPLRAGCSFRILMEDYV